VEGEAQRGNGGSVRETSEGPAQQMLCKEGDDSESHATSGSALCPGSSGNILQKAPGNIQALRSLSNRWTASAQRQKCAEALGMCQASLQEDGGAAFSQHRPWGKLTPC
jgi:hypothetical protein